MINANFINSILLCGNYGATNLGDEAILDGILIELKKIYPEAEVTVLSYNPSETASLHQVQAQYFLPLGIRSIWRGLFKGELKETLQQFKKADLFILGGGGLLTDEKLYAVILWTLHLFVAHVYHKTIWIYANSIGPLQTKIGQYLTKKALQSASYISVRDHSSKALIQSLGIKQPIDVVKDPVFSLNLSTLSPYHLTTLSPYVVISLRPWTDHQNKILQTIPNIIDWLIENYKYEVILVPFQKLKDNDSALLRKIYNRVKNKKSVQINEFSPDYKAVIVLIKNAKLVIGMRLHAIIFAYLVNTSFFGIIYSQKITNFLQDIGLEKQGITLEQMSASVIKEKVHKIIGN